MEESRQVITLRENQNRSIRAVHEAMRKGYRKVLMVAPTGMGKRICAVWWCGKAQEQEKRALFVTNRRLLVKQMFDETQQHGLNYGVIMSQTHPVDSRASIQIASLQTLESRYFEDSNGIPTPERMPPANVILVDEAHQDVDRYDALFNLYSDVYGIGLTATPVDKAGKSLSPKHYDCIVEEVRNTELIAAGLLLPTRVYAPSEPNIEGVKIVNKEEYSQRSLGKAVKECTVFADVFNEWAPHADRKTVCFCPGVAYARDLVNQFNSRLGKDSAHLIYAETTHGDRERILDMIRTGASKVLVSVDVLREGFDLPEISCGIDLQPNSQLRTYWQKVGRIKRAFDGQTEAVWLDFAGNYWRFPHPDDDPDWSVTGDETTQQRIEKRRKEGEEQQPIMCPKCGAVRKNGGICPECQYKAADQIRRIRMGNGKLKEIPAKAKEKRQKTEAERLLGQWKSQLFVALNSGRMTFHQCASIYQKKTGHWPENGWPGVSQNGSAQWKRLVTDVMTKRDLMVQASNAERDLVKG
jgi:DNA repair protein RadD